MKTTTTLQAVLDECEVTKLVGGQRRKFALALEKAIRVFQGMEKKRPGGLPGKALDEIVDIFSD